MALVIVETIIIALLFAILVLLVASERRIKKGAIPKARVDAYWQGTERRKFFRFKRCLDATYRIEHKPHIQTYCRTADVSEGGLCLVLDAKFASGDILDLLIELPGVTRSIEAAGKVVWCEEASDEDDPSGKRFFHIGIQFCRIAGHHAKAFTDFIKSISGPGSRD